jgi:hypothetical protein
MASTPMATMEAKSFFFAWTEEDCDFGLSDDAEDEDTEDNEDAEGKGVTFVDRDSLRFAILPPIHFQNGTE